MKFNSTDVGNAERFADRHGERARFCAATGWLVWDGRRWALDRDGEVRRLAVDTVRSIYGEAGALENDAERKALSYHANRSESERRIAAMLKLAEVMPTISVVPERFDGPETSFLLNVENGTLDLRTGELRAHRPEDHITKLAPVEWDPNARSEAWDGFLEEQVPDAEVRAFLRRAAGYNLTGSTGEEKLFFVYGPTAAGKGTFTEALKATLGQYALTSPFETFLRRRGDSGVRDDIARLAGTRMVLASEVDEGRAFDVAALKTLTGGDTVAARHLYGRIFEFKPAFKLWLVGNHGPHANAQDAALWRRVLVVPFTRSVPEKRRDPAVKVALTQDPAARAAILAWTVHGCLEWQRSGLLPPEAVRIATATYRDDCDDVRRFLTEVFEPGATELHGVPHLYTEWCKANGEKPVSGKRLGQALRDHGSIPGKRDGARVWLRAEGHQGHQGHQNPELFPSVLSQGEVMESAVSGVPAIHGDSAAEGMSARERPVLGYDQAAGGGGGILARRGWEAVRE